VRQVRDRFATDITGSAAYIGANAPEVAAFAEPDESSNSEPLLEVVEVANQDAAGVGIL
jgi:hypothetical protein